MDINSFRQNYFYAWKLADALGQLRGVFGMHLLHVAVAHGLDIGEDLSSIVPARDTELNSDSDNIKLPERLL